mmetsp:Transcript_106350/g.200246  ORF Transcript_106350/g.200246 Transcript_106350/m.200246 type:complete len:258 (-) Transcript_106350:486-1259(-)
MLVSSTGCSDRIFWSRKVGNLPGLATVQRDLSSNDLQTTTYIGVAAYLHSFGNFWPLKLEVRVVPWLKHCRIEIHMIDYVLILEPPTLFGCKISIHMRGQDPVVKEMIVAGRRLRRYPHFAKPFDHAATNTSRKQGPQRCAMIRREQFSILFEGQQNIPFTIQCPAHIDGCAINTSVSLWEFSLGAFKVYKAMFFADPLDAKSVENIAKSHPRPHSVADGRTAPIESDCLLCHVLLLPAIASANEGHRDAHLRTKFS